MAVAFTRLPRLTALTRPFATAPLRVQHRRLPGLIGQRSVHASASSGEPPERFYQFYLEELRINHKGVETCPWLKDRDADAAEEALEPVWRHDPLSVFDSPTCDIELAGRCLEAFALRAHERADQRADVRRQLMTAKPGTRALHWLIQSGAYQTADLALEPRFSTFTAHCLTAERSDERVLTWVQSALNPGNLASLPHKQASAWKGVLLMLLLEHRVFWSNDDLNLAFMPLLKAFMWNIGPSRQPLDREIPLQQSVIWTLQQLRNSRNQSVDPKQYDRFTALYKKQFSNSDDHLYQLDLAHLALFHPTTPRADLALQHILSWPTISEQESFYQRYLQPKNKPVAHFMLHFIVNTAQMLATQDRTSDARHVLRIGKSLIPDLFKMQDVWHAVENFRRGRDAFDRRRYFARESEGISAASMRRKSDVVAARLHGNFR